MHVAWWQSKTTHQGDEAADCARLLSWLCAHAIRSGGGKEGVLDAAAAFPARLCVLHSRPYTPLRASARHARPSIFTDRPCLNHRYATRCLAHSAKEQEHVENIGLNLHERDWRWRAPNYCYCAARVAADPGYAGSYAMDCLAMALHCVHTTETFEGALLKAAGIGGDADTLAAVTGQLAGAIYGAGAIPQGWLDAVERWDPKRSMRARGWLLFHARRAETGSPNSPTVWQSAVQDQPISFTSWEAMQVATASSHPAKRARSTEPWWQGTEEYSELRAAEAKVSKLEYSNDTATWYCDVNGKGCLRPKQADEYPPEHRRWNCSRFPSCDWCVCEVCHASEHGHPHTLEVVDPAALPAAQAQLESAKAAFLVHTHVMMGGCDCGGAARMRAGA